MFGRIYFGDYATGHFLLIVLPVLRSKSFVYHNMQFKPVVVMVNEQLYHSSGDNKVTSIIYFTAVHVLKQQQVFKCDEMRRTPWDCGGQVVED